jgi:hypothetical protein
MGVVPCIEMSGWMQASRSLTASVLEEASLGLFFGIAGTRLLLVVLFWRVEFTFTVALAFRLRWLPRCFHRS